MGTRSVMAFARSSSKQPRKPNFAPPSLPVFVSVSLITSSSKTRKMAPGAQEKRQLKVLKSIMGIKGNELGTLTLPRKEPLAPEEAMNCESCTVELTGRSLTSMTQRISYRCVQVGSESPIFLRELPPCRRCGTAEDFNLYTFEASVKDIAKVQKMMNMHKDVDWLSEFSRIDVEKSPGRCTIKSNSISTLKSIPT